MKILSFLLCLVVISLSAQAAKFYKWKDDQGVVHYTTNAPEDRKAETVNTRKGPGEVNQDHASKNINPASARQKEVSKKVSPGSSASTTPQPARAKELAIENCKTARKNLEILNYRARVRINDEKTGELRYLTPEEHAAKKLSTQQNIDEFCS